MLFGVFSITLVGGRENSSDAVPPLGPYKGEILTDPGTADRLALI